MIVVVRRYGVKPCKRDVQVFERGFIVFRHLMNVVELPTPNLVWGGVGWSSGSSPLRNLWSFPEC